LSPLKLASHCAIAVYWAVQVVPKGAALAACTQSAWHVAVWQATAV